VVIDVSEVCGRSWSWIVTFRADKLEEPISDTRSGAVIYYGRLGGSSGTAESDVCDPTSSSTTADNSDIGRHWTKSQKNRRPVSLLQSDSLLAYTVCKAA